MIKRQFIQDGSSILSLSFPIFFIIGCDLCKDAVFCSARPLIPMIPFLDAMRHIWSLMYNTNSPTKVTAIMTLLWTILFPLALWHGGRFVLRVGYPILILISLVPPLWRSVIHPIVSNIKPRHRTQSLTTMSFRTPIWILILIVLMFPKVAH